MPQPIDSKILNTVHSNFKFTRNMLYRIKYVGYIFFHTELLLRPFRKFYVSTMKHVQNMSVDSFQHVVIKSI